MRRTSPLLTVTALIIALAAGCAKGDPSAGRAKHRTAAATVTSTRAETNPTTTATSTDGATDATDDDAEAALAKLDLDQRTGQLVMTWVHGPTLSAAEARSLRGQHLGGAILFDDAAGNGIDGLRRLVAEAQTAARAGNSALAGLLVATDQEPGPDRELTDLPPAASVGAIAAGGPAAARAAGAETARGLHAAGIDLDLAPVADLDEAPARVMRGRALGSDARAVAPLVGAFIDGIHAGGGAATAKHFPGLGGSTANSDDGRADVERSRAELDHSDLAPFRAAIEHDVDVVMISHGVYAALDATHNASLSRPVVKTLLRNELHYDGIAMSDSLNARGVREVTGGTTPEACADAVAAGIDMVLLTGSMETARICRRHIVEAVRDGTIPQSRIDEAALRVLRLKARLGLLPAG